LSGGDEKSSFAFIQIRSRLPRFYQVRKFEPKSTRIKGGGTASRIVSTTFANNVSTTLLKTFKAAQASSDPKKIKTKPKKN
jgi:hypothetical protein